MYLIMGVHHPKPGMEKSLLRIPVMLPRTAIPHSPSSPSQRSRDEPPKVGRPVHEQTHRLSANGDGSPRSQAFRTSQGDRQRVVTQPCKQRSPTLDHTRVVPSVAARWTLEWLIHGHPTTSGSSIAKSSC